MNNPIIKIKNIYKKYGKFEALKNVSINIQENSIFGLLGSNGAGKTTLLHIITGLLNQSEGEIHIFNEKIDNYSNNLKKRIAIVPQKISLYEDLSIYDNLYFFGNAYGLKKQEIKNRINELTDILQLGNLKRKIKTLSGGYQRRTSLAVGLIGHPEILILDEALVGIDLETKKIISNLLKQLKNSVTIIITTHSIREAEEFCDEICFLHRGKKVIQGNTKTIIENYSKTHGEKIIVTFNNPNSAKEFYKEHLHNSVKIKDNEITITFSSSKHNAKDIISFVKNNSKYQNYIESIEANKPNLEDVMLKLINSGKNK